VLQRLRPSPVLLALDQVAERSKSKINTILCDPGDTLYITSGDDYSGWVKKV